MIPIDAVVFVVPTFATHVDLLGGQIFIRIWCDIQNEDLRKDERVGFDSSPGNTAASTSFIIEIGIYCAAHQMTS